ncbi:MAG: 1-deoxy-D-xylulose-5-phosphate synthase [Lachnospiraceae bacterium]|nr:1-deoxy-D-xylulose-5-phosphate synthase [Lachnospiraceae bacterium]
MILDRINEVNDIKNISEEDLPSLASEIREFLIEKISKQGGHLGSNLGAVELTMALHRALNLPEDKIIWDVGHQSYTHKILTGRKDGFDNLRSYKGLAGFPKRVESDCDAFNTGHSSTSISAGLGMVAARDIKGTNETIVSVIGDGSMTGGMAYEALNNAAKLETNFIIVLNDNNMSISENVGGFSKYLNSIRTSETYMDIKDGIYYKIKDTRPGSKVVDTVRKTKNSLKQLVVPGMFFEDMGITYLGPVDGHDIQAVEKAINEAKKRKMAVLVHVITQKGRGYEPAMRHPARFHGASPFDVETGIPLNQSKTSYTDIFSTVMTKLGARDERVVAITAAMPDGTGLKRFRNMYPDRFFDVGIAEEHAVTFAAGLAASGLRPVVAIYSSFLQRAYDQIIHDVCLQNLPVIFAVDRAGIVGADGETHQGIFDLSFLSSIPNMTVMAPKNKWELSDMMKFALNYDGPVAIRYPRGEAYAGLQDSRAPMEMGKAELLYAEGDICLMAVGTMVKTAEEVRELLKEKGYKCSLVNARFVKPIDEFATKWAADNHKMVVTMEENVLSGGYGEKVRTYIDSIESKAKVLNIALKDDYVEHGNVELLKKELGIDSLSITASILSALNK